MRRKRRAAAGLALTVLLAPAPGAYAACDAGPGVLRGKTSKVTLAFRTTPPVIKVGELFSLQAGARAVHAARRLKLSFSARFR